MNEIIELEYFLILSAIMFAAGLFGVLTQKNAVRILISVEIMLNAANISLVAFNGVFGLTEYEGWSFALIIIGIAAAEAAIGLAIFLSVFRNYDQVIVGNLFSLGETQEEII